MLLTSRSLFAGMLAAVVLAGCEPAPAPPKPAPKAEPAVDAAPEPARPTAAGSFLAGRQAVLQRDLPTSVTYLQQTLELDPGNTELRRKALQLALTAGELPAAFEDAAVLVRDNPQDYYATLVLAVQKAALKDFTGAMEQLGRGAVSSTTALWVPFLEAWLQAGQGDLAVARDRLAGDAAPPQLKPLYQLHQGLLAGLAGDDQAALAAHSGLGQELAQQPLRLVLFQARTLTRLGRPEAVDALLDGYGQNPSARVLADRLRPALHDANGELGQVRTAQDGLAEVLLDIGDLLDQEPTRELAIAHVRLAVFLRPDLEYARLMLGRLLTVAGHGEAALAEYAQIPPDGPLGWQVRLQTADTLASLERWDRVVAVLQGMQEEAPKDVQMLARLGDALRQQKQFAAALGVYQQATAALGTDGGNAEHWGLWFAKGVAAHRADRWPDAEAAFKKALQLSPDQPQVLNYLAYSWVEQGVHLEQALAMLRRAVALAPQDGAIIDSLGWAYVRLGQHDKGVEYLARAVALEPADPLILDHLADAYWHVGRKREARFLWQQALGFNPEPADRERIQGKLTSGL